MSDINLSKSDNNLPKPRLSVIIVSYNCAAFLGLTLHALLWKKQDGLEVLVVDNASSDDTAALLRSRFPQVEDRKSTRLNSSHVRISYAVFCLKKKKKTQ